MSLEPVTALHEALPSHVYATLKEFGPSTAWVLATRLEVPRYAIAQALLELQLCARVETLVRRKVGKRDAVWLIPGDTRLKRRRAANKNPAIDPLPKAAQRDPYISDDDLAWQAYYRLPRAERRGLPPPESGRGIAGWDCPRTLDELRQGGLSEGEGRP